MPLIKRSVHYNYAQLEISPSLNHVRMEKLRGLETGYHEIYFNELVICSLFGQLVIC